MFEKENVLNDLTIEEKLHLTDEIAEDIFAVVDEFISCMETLHPQWFTQEKTEEIRTILEEVRIIAKTIQTFYLYSDVVDVRI